MSLLEKLEARVGTITEEQARAALLAWVESPSRLTALVRKNGSALAALDYESIDAKFEVMPNRDMFDASPHPPLLVPLVRRTHPEGVYAWTGRGCKTASTSALLDRFLCCAERELLQIDRRGVTLLIPGNAGWPECLDTSWNPPSLLYVRGIMPQLRSCPGLALVGSRKNVGYGMRIARSLSNAWVKMGGVVVSGGAAGVDTAAHRGALDAGGKTVVVAGTGLARTYPLSNRELFEEVASQGAVISELPLQASAKPFHFPERNRIIAGLSGAVVIVQARNGSGALHTARFALKCRRMLFAVPGPVDDEACAGGLQLLSQGVAPLTNGGALAELFAQLTGAVPPRPLPLSSTSPPAVSITQLNPRAALLLEILQEGETHLDDLAARSGLTLGEVSLALVDLELKGWVQRTPGNHYQSTVRLKR